jgi:hypothetical protein
MSVNSYLTNLANAAILRDQEKQDIQRSIATLQTRLKAHFGGQIGEHFVFGSYSRGTILPRSMDAQSDVDYIVIFTDSGLQPQSYLDRLRRFAERYYSSSETTQSHPTVVLELNHIRFELVPALQSWWSGLQIPAKGSNYQSWQDTDPKGFNDKLTSANQANGNLIKPLVRVMKYWNAKAGYPFESYSLEQTVAGHGYGFLGLLASRQIGDYFYQILDAIDAGLFAPQWKTEAVARLKQVVSQAKAFDRAGQSAQAEAVLMKLLPPVGGLLGR